MLQRFGEQAPEREVKFAPVDFKRIAADGTFSGYASIFGKEDMGRDVVMPGAFRESLVTRGPSGIKLLFQHDPNEPIGVWLTLKEDATGLFVRGRLMQEVMRAREVLSLMRAGALDGLSIGFRTVKGRTDPATGTRWLHQIDLWEISVVTFPMLAEARVGAVKHRYSNSNSTFPGHGSTHRPSLEAGFVRPHTLARLRAGLKALADRPDAAGGGTPTTRLAGALRRAAGIVQGSSKRMT